MSNLITQPRSTTDASTSFEILRKAVSDHISQFDLHCHSFIQLLHEESERLKTSLAIAHSTRLAEQAGSEISSTRRSWDLGIPLTPCLPPVPVAPPLQPLTPRQTSPRVTSPRVAWKAGTRMAQDGDGSLMHQHISWHPLTNRALAPSLNEGQETAVSRVGSSVFQSEQISRHPLTNLQSKLSFDEGTELTALTTRTSGFSVFGASSDKNSRGSRNSEGCRERTPRSAVENWERMFTDICIPKSNRAWRWMKLQKTGLHHVWTRVSTFSSDSSASEDAADSLEHGPTSSQVYIYNDFGLRVGRVVKSRNSCIPVVHPDSKYGILHCVIQGALIVFDVVDFPLSAFRTGQPEHGDITLFISVFFWTWDLIFSFLQGFVSATGVIEMRPSQIARNYVRGWFMFDLVVVAFDWVSFVAFILQETMDSDSSLARATKLGKIQRLARGGRILRLAKVVETFHAVLDGVGSAESVVIIARIIGLLLLIVLINHYIACVWYSIAEGSDREDTWIKEKAIIDYDLFDRYFYSLHWSLTQFTPCTNDIAPANADERAFACLVVTIALMTFATFLSSLTSATVQMKKLNWERYNEKVQIRDFMHGKQVPTTVAHRVWQYYRKHYRLRNRSVVESEVHFFQVMPKSLRKELRCHAYIPTLMHHPVMQELIFNPKHHLGPILCEIVSVLVPVSGQDVFLEGDEATHMYYFVNGSGNYTFWGGAHMLSAPDHTTEAALWLKDWQHPGRLTVTNNRCELLLVGSAEFTSCVERQAAPSTVRDLRKYASLFAQHHQDLQNDHHEPLAESQLLQSLTPIMGVNTSVSSSTPFGTAASKYRKSIVIHGGDLALPPSVLADLMARAFPRSTNFEHQTSVAASYSSFSVAGRVPLWEALKNWFVNNFGNLCHLCKSNTQ